MMIVASIVSDQSLASRRKPILVMGLTTAFLGLLVTALADTSPTTSCWGLAGGTDETPQQQLQHYRNGVYHFLLLGGIVIRTGIGSVYCIMAEAMSDHTNPTERATAMGMYKFWRDSGYAVGGLLTGVVADPVPTTPGEEGPPSIGSLSIPTVLVAGYVGLLIVCIFIFYREGRN